MERREKKEERKPNKRNYLHFFIQRLSHQIQFSSEKDVTTKKKKNDKTFLNL